MQKILLTPLMIAALAALAAGPVAARPSGSTAETTEPAPAPQSDPLTTGTIGATSESRRMRLEDCMAIWEPATHMTKKQWRRTCENQLDEEPNL